LAFMNTLESFTLKYQRFIDNPKYFDNSFQHFQFLFKNLHNLKAIDMNFGDNCLMAEEWKSILNGLYELHHMEKFKLQGKILHPLKPGELS